MMSVDAHRRATELMSEAELAEMRGDRPVARKLYLDAAEAEFHAFQHIPSSRPKTKGSIAVSMVNLYRAAGDLEEAQRAAHHCLSLRDLPDFAIEQIKEIVAELDQEEVLRKQGTVLASDRLDVALRGGAVGVGAVALETITWKLQQLYKFIVRVMEWVDGKPFRGNVPPPPSLLRLCTPMMTEPVAGSFRFEVRFQTPLQPILPTFEDPDVLTPEKVTESCLDIIGTVVDGSPEALSSPVTDERYRDLFLKLIRSLAPDGRDIGEIDFARAGRLNRQTRVLKPDIRRKINVYFSEQYPPGGMIEHHAGILRGLNLDKAWISLQQTDGLKRYGVLKAEIEGFDDIVGPLVNKPVRVSGYWTGGRRHRFLVRDIDLEVSSAEEAPAPR